MSSFLPVFREEVKVISRNTESARKPGSPQSHQRSSHICEAKFALHFGRIDEPGTFFRWADSPGPNSLERAIDSESIKNVARRSEPVTALLQFTEVRD